MHWLVRILFAVVFLLFASAATAEETCPCPDPEESACPDPQGMVSPGSIIGLITGTEANPFDVKMREGADECTDELGVDLRTFAGEFNGDVEAQIAAIENLISAGAVGFAITPADPAALVPSIQQAREAGLKVVVLDRPLDPADAADATLASDNRQAGQQIGAWAQSMLGDAAQRAKIGLLTPSAQQPYVMRDQGFMEGFGIDVLDPTTYGDEVDPRVCAHEVTGGSIEGAREAMSRLLTRCSDLNVVFAVNEDAAAGGYEALHAAGKADGSVLIVNADGGCQSVADVRAGLVGATIQQSPKAMAGMAMRMIATGTVPSGGEHLRVPTTLVTDRPVADVVSMATEDALSSCW